MTTRQRRRSSLGPIGLGDNAGPSLSTMPINHSKERESRKRIRALSQSSPDSSSSPVSASSTVSTASSITSSSLSKPERAKGLAWIWFREFAYRNTWFLPLLALGSCFSLYAGLEFFAPHQNFMRPFFELSYKTIDPTTGEAMYGKGKKDFLFVAMFIVFFTFFREFCMQILLRPLAIKLGIARQSKISRFMEQTYSIVYYSMSGPFGLYIMYKLPLWYFDTTMFYVNFPHREHIFEFKLFYLLQASFWTQQSIVLSLMLEKPRKDFYELVFHHIITMALIFLSYRFHFTWIGLAVYITMDISDLFLAFSKTLNYLGSSLAVPFFVFFAGVWTYTRHYLNLKILYSIATEFATVGPFELNWETQQYKCWISQYITFALLLALQLVNAYWMFLIIRVAVRLVVSGEKKDDRSDDESEEEITESSESGEEEKKDK